MSQANPKVAQLFADSILSLVADVATGNAHSARIRFTAPDGPTYNNFCWIMVDRIGEQNEKVWAHTNDADFMVGYPPTFNQSVELAEAPSLVEPIVAYLSDKLGRYPRLEVLVQIEPRPTQVINMVGDSEGGFANIREQATVDLC